MIRANHDQDYEHHERIIENVGAKRRLNVLRINYIWLIIGTLEVLFGLRFLLKLIAANPVAPFARLVYNFSYLFLRPFDGLAAPPLVDGIILEVPTLIAMFVYALIG